MRNKFVLAFLLIPVVIGCQNTTVIQNSSSPKSSLSASVTTTPTNVVSNIYVSPTVNVSSTQSINPTPSNIEESVTPIIESNMIEESLVYTGLNVSLPSLPDEYMKELGEVIGYVYDMNNNPIENAIVRTTNKKFLTTKYNFSYETKTDSSGKFIIITPKIDTIDSDLRLLTIEVYKNNYTKRFLSIPLFNTLHPIDNEETDIKFINGPTYLYSINMNPEIQDIKINNNKLTGYLTSQSLNSGISTNIGQKIKPSINLSRLKLENADTLNIEFKFNNSIIKESLEKNLIIESLDKLIKYDFNSENTKFIWSNDNKEVIFECPIQKYNKDMKYKLFFKEPFIDSNNNKAFQGEYISLKSFQFNELSENIVFEVAGSN